MKGSALVQGLQRLQRLPQALQFALVGASAAATHLLVVGLLVHGTGMAPLVANGLAFVVAFGVSYNGHALLTFARTQARGWAVVARYFAVASLSFAVNEVLYAAALRWLDWNYLASLLLVLLLVAAGTFVLSKTWVFKAPGKA